MTLEFQKDLLKILLQDRSFRKYIEKLPDKLFELAEHDVVFQLLKKYYEKYRNIPTYSSMLEFWDISAKEQNVVESVYEVVKNSLVELYEPYKGDISLLRESIVENAQYKAVKLLIQTYADRFKDEGLLAYKKFRVELDKIISLEDSLKDSEDAGKFLVKDYCDPIKDSKNSCPTFLKGLNFMTAARGFYAPQLIVFMGSPKGFKTGTVMKLALEYAKQGHKVFYADTENGVNSIENRFKQAILECTYDDLFSGAHNKTLEALVKGVSKIGGEIRIEPFDAYAKTIGDVEVKLEELEEKHGFKPDIIIYDYLDLFLSKDVTKRREKRINIQHVYMEAINLQKKLGCFGITPSQVNRAALNAKVINMGDFAEDFGKAMNAHAAFAICRTEEEIKNGVARLLPVMQREGVAQAVGNSCLLSIDESRMCIREITYEDYMQKVDLEEEKSKNKNVRVRAKVKRVDISKLTDD